VAAADRSAGLEAHRLVPLVFHGLALHSAGQEAASVAAWRRGEQLAEELGAAWSAPFFHYGRALAHWDEGNWGDLLAEADAALEFARCHGTALAIGFACAVGAGAHLFQRRLDIACKLLDEGDELLGRGGLQYGADWLAWIRALHLEASGDSVGALELLDGAWQVASALRAEAALSLFGPDLIRLHLLAGDRDNAERVLGHLESAQHDTIRTTVDASARMWRAALDNDLAGLADVRATYVAFPRPVQVVLVDEAAVIGALLHGDLVEARLRLHDVVVGTDRLDCAGIADRAERAAVSLGLPAKPERRPARPVSGWGSLTDTERAVARMVASGSSNVAVADALGISRRTVESHLYHTFTKLDVRNRTELAIVAVRELGEVSRVSSSSGC
jgi:DNA-binding CsgD family transcriptional regulator